MKDKIKFLQKYFYEKIPVTKKLGIDVADYDGETLVLKAPLKNNHNDKGTAFAGSIYSVATLSGWGLVSLKLHEENIDAKIAIYTGNITYKKPINFNFNALCRITDKNEWDKFINRVKNKSNGKIQLKIEVFNADNLNNEPAVFMTAEYFAWLNKEYLP